jgi:hypothetical protein
MSATLSLSIFTIEADRKPVLAFAAKKHEEADAFFRDERVRTKLRSVSSGGVPFCDDLSTLRIRLANAGARTRYREKMTTSSTGDPATVFLVCGRKIGSSRRGSTSAYRKSSPSILVMQSTQDRMAQNAPRCLGGT